MNIILELGCNHNGNVATALRMIDDAVRLKVQGVKLQKRDIDSIPLDVSALPRDPVTSFGTTYREHRKVLEFNCSTIIKLKEYAEDQGLLFVMSVFDLISMRDMIEQCRVKYIKLPSQFLCNQAINDALLNYRYSTSPKFSVMPDIQIMHSTGMHTTKEAIGEGYLAHFDVTFYCRSMYPFERGFADVGSAITIFDCVNDRRKCGYSSHDKDGQAIPYFVIAGAQWIERHYTLDKNMKGSDHNTVSSDFKEMQRIIQSVEDARECIYADKLSDTEKKIREIYVRKV